MSTKPRDSLHRPATPEKKEPNICTPCWSSALWLNWIKALKCQNEMDLIPFTKLQTEIKHLVISCACWTHASLCFLLIRETSTSKSRAGGTSSFARGQVPIVSVFTLEQVCAVARAPFVLRGFTGSSSQHSYRGRLVPLGLLGAAEHVLISQTIT